MKSKRLKLTLGCLMINFMIVSFGIIQLADLMALGTCLAMINAPLYAYVFAETIRKSDL
jgi:hypothetical protein